MISMSRSSPTISSALYVFRGIIIIPLSYITTAFLYKQLALFLGCRSEKLVIIADGEPIQIQTIQSGLSLLPQK